MVRCDRCSGKLIITEDREECMDICDKCHEHLNKMSDRDYRMACTRAAVAYVNCVGMNDEEVRLRAFFGTIMPEYPLHKVDKICREHKNKIK